MINENLYMRLCACCFPVKGALQSIICDTQRGEYRIIPNDLFDILSECNGWQLKKLFEAFGEENRETILEYLEILEEQEFIFYCDSEEELKLFTDISMDWDFPALIANAIIDVDAGSEHDFAAIVPQLEELGCGNLELRVFAHREQVILESFFKALETSCIEHVNLVLPHHPAFGLKDYEDLFIRHIRLMSLIVHSCEDESLFKAKVQRGMSICFTPQRITDASCCGFIHPQQFNSTIDFFLEAQQHNTCLNRKISIDVNGEIRNCPAMSRSFGHISQTRLADALAYQDFARYWFVNKDQVSVCRDCEFRYICHDCRAFTEDPGQLYAKPLRCSYNPYEARWTDTEIETELNEKTGEMTVK